MFFDIYVSCEGMKLGQRPNDSLDRLGSMILDDVQRHLRRDNVRKIRKTSDKDDFSYHEQKMMILSMSHVDIYIYIYLYEFKDSSYAHKRI